MVETFNKLPDLSEKEFRNFCKNKTKKINNYSSIDIASALFHLATRCEFEKIDSLLKIIQNKEQYMANLIKNNFPYCYIIGNFEEKEWFNAKNETK